MPYALEHIQIQMIVDGTTLPHSAGGREHWDEMATTALALPLPLVALVAPLHTQGWRLVALTSGIGPMVFGLAVVLMPAQASSPGLVWGAVALVSGRLVHCRGGGGIETQGDNASRPSIPGGLIDPCRTIESPPGTDVTTTPRGESLVTPVSCISKIVNPP